ncbi:ABC transporter permease [Nocardiopsis sp. HNM0947]|uniref:ABC transporter permease n=1 Tax=Nocardiopsis coralli TaxID=2772213 RepID=A0ABR9PAL2_9ACTN|nr:ABC transporter permease [Nocardiopsis coralli]MBE3000876.1 ABC transporter permease [Nocardiopsis coralli]
MLAFALRRAGSGLTLVLVISVLAHTLLALPDPDVGRQLLGPAAPQELVDEHNAALGLDRPLAVRYADWLAAAVRFDLGHSWFTNESVTQSLANRLPVTLSLMGGVTLVTAVVSFVLGVWAGVRRGAVDSAVQAVGVIGYALPSFLITLIMVIVFAVQLGWFPAVGYTPPGVSLTGWLSTITLPVLALSVPAVAGVSQQVRSSVIDVLGRDHVRTLRARGLPFPRVVFRHVLRGAATPALTVLAMQFVGMLGGAVIVEQIFGLPGIGAMTVQYTTRGDIPVIMGVVMVSVLVVVVVNLLVDVLVAWLNPKARLS